MAEPYAQEVKDAVNAAAQAGALDDRAAAALAASFYKNRDTGMPDGQFGAGWTVLEQANEADGYDGLAMIHDKSNTLVIVNRGTEGFSSIQDWVANIKGILGIPGGQMTSAIDLLERSFDKAPSASRILICGHSLGGALADAQGVLAKPLFAKRGITCPPLRAVGVASPGFQTAVRNYAASKDVKPDTEAQAYIIHYIREKDLVPTYPGRSVFGVDQKIASIFEARKQEAAGGRGGMAFPQWRRITDLQKQHQRTSYYHFFNESKARHIWYSKASDDFDARDGSSPKWNGGFEKPDDA